MRIAMFVPSWPPGHSANGIVTYAACLIPELRRRGHEVYVLTNDLHDSGTDRSFTIDITSDDYRPSYLARGASRLFPGRFRRPDHSDRLLAALKDLCSRHVIDVFEIEETFGWCKTVCDARLLPVVARLHGPWFVNGRFDRDPLPSDEVRIRQEGQGIQAATLVTAPSKDVLERVRREYEIELGHAKVIPNPAPVDQTSVWSYGTCDKTNLLYVGRFDRRKGGDLVLRAFEDLLKRYPDLTLTFVGPDIGVIEPNGEILSFTGYADKYLALETRDRIDFRGKLPNSELLPLRLNAFLTIVASQFEILPYAIMEAMALGCPIVASNVGGIPELIVDRHNGLLFDSQDSAQLVAACTRMIDEPSFASTLGHQARVDCANDLDPSRLATETLSAYQEAIARFRAQGRDA